MSLCAERDPLDRHATVDRGRHGREEHRRVELFAVAGRLPPEWREVVACAARITRLSWCKDTIYDRVVAYYNELSDGAVVGRREQPGLAARTPGA